MSFFAPSSSAQTAYVCNIPVGEIQANMSSSVAAAGSGSANASNKRTAIISLSRFIGLLSSSERIKIGDTFAEKRRSLYSMIESSPLDDDSQPLAFFEEMRQADDDLQCFGQIQKIFLGAYRKKNTAMVVKTLRFMQNFRYEEIGKVGLSAARMSLLESKNLDIQSAALSLILLWKANEFRNVLEAYHAPKDPFINIKIKKISAWFTSER